MRLTLFGYWHSPETPDLPDPAALVDPDWEMWERSEVADYLEQGHVARQFLGVSRCRICGEVNGSAEFTDGEYLWPSGLAHYVREHAVRLPERITAHILRRTAEWEEVEVDASWWRERAYRATPQEGPLAAAGPGGRRV
ncbi:hypothetical protein [Kitasatospora sp. NPDC051914]|uniref:hypothetical protein n=1 Tax=Kitasatospora sp. NPDC051914 TaxID=3154945 RepID=UPI0034161593